MLNGILFNQLLGAWKQAMKIPEHYLYLESYVEKLLEHDSFDQNVFLMVRYTRSPQLEQLRRTLVRTLRDLDLNPLIASDRAFHTQLWDNICVYMLASKYGIAVFEQIETPDFNPNIAIELGFMTSLGRRCLPLKDRRMAALPVDIGSLIYKEFDSYNMPETLAAALTEWVDRDLELSSSFLENLLGTYTSQWGFAGNWTNMGIAVITGSGNEVNVVLRDDRASSYTAKLQAAGPKRLRATWVNVDFPNDYGTWEAQVTADFNTIEGRWKSGRTSASGDWRLKRVS